MYTIVRMEGDIACLGGALGAALRGETGKTGSSTASVGANGRGGTGP